MEKRGIDREMAKSKYEQALQDIRARFEWKHYFNLSKTHFSFLYSKSINFNPTRKSQYNSVYKDSMIGVFQKSQEIEKTRQEFVKVHLTWHT